MGIDGHQITSGLVKALLLVVISGCAIVSEPPVVDNSTTQKVFVGEQKPSKIRFGKFRSSKVYEVRKGDTLYSIAWKYGVSYRVLAVQNNIAPPYVIYPGQELSVSTSKKKKQVAKKVANSRNDKVTLNENKSSRDSSVATKESWVWPVKIKPSTQYSTANKGIDYSLVKSTSLLASGKGSVVYEGGGIGGFENLIIIKHSTELLSAYSFNGRAKIKEQQKVESGDILARINPNSENKKSLHFEVRRNGRPIDPSTLIKVSI